VAAPALAEALRADHPELEIVCAPTPELDTVLESLLEMMAEDPGEEQTYLSPGVTPEAMAALFRATAALYRAQPWQVVPSDESLIAITIEQLDMHDAMLSVIGQLGESFGVLLFASLEDFDSYLDAARQFEAGETPQLPPHLVLDFERGADLAPALRKEVAEHHWEVADNNAYPWVVAVDRDLVARPPTAREVTLIEAIAAALVQLLSGGEALAGAWEEGHGQAERLTVKTAAGELEVVLQPLPADDGMGFESELELLDALTQLDLDPDNESARELRLMLEDALLQRFETSPEAEPFTRIDSCGPVMEFAAIYLGETIATLDGAGLEEVLFDLIPRKASIDASEAEPMIEELRAFYRFLKREFRLAQADGCLSVLNERAVARLRAALTDSGNFGIAKSLAMAGRDAGFDMQSREGIESWMETVQGTQLPPDFPLPDYPGQAPPEKPASKKSAKARKGKRKAARKARRKNR
jgi:hypothetical protein